jgi:hypothetical protein
MRVFSFLHFLCGVVLVSLMGCASSGEETADAPPISVVQGHEWGEVTLNQGPDKLRPTVRKIGQETGGGLVMMYGIGDLDLPPLIYTRADMEKVVADLAHWTATAYQKTPRYYFLYVDHPEYHQLLDISLAGTLHDRYDGIATELAFGAGMPLFTVFAWIGHGLGVGENTDVAIVADNAVSQAYAGEVSLGKVPLQEGLEAILRSALTGGFGVDSTEEYIFLHSLANPSERSQLLNEHELSERQREYLEREVDLVLPRPPDDPGVLEMRAGARPLAAVLDSLSRQLGIKVVAESELLDIPINPAVMNGVRVRTALDLLIRQWPIQGFGYHMAGDRIILKRR